MRIIEGICTIKNTTKPTRRPHAQHKFPTFWGTALLVTVLSSCLQRYSPQKNNDHLGSYVQDRFWSSEPETDGKSCGLARRSQASLCFLLIVSK